MKRILFVFVFVFGLATACHEARAVNNNAVAVPADAGTAPVLMSNPPDASALATPTLAKKPIGPAERRAYWKGITEGRKATIDRRYAVAIAAFDQALEAIPDDGRALGERGFARLKANDLDGARDDFERALIAVPITDKNLLAQIEFNLGLVDQQRGYKGDTVARKAAGVHFLRSYQLHPTEEARNEIPRDCPVSVLKPTLVTYASIAEASAKLLAEYTFEVKGPTSIEGSSAQVLEVNSRGKIMLPLDGGRFARVDVGLTGTWDCGLLGEVKVTRASNIYTVVYQAHRGGRSPGICSCENGEPCDSGWSEYGKSFPKCTCASPMCPLVCGGAEALEGWHIETWVDAKTGEGLWQVALDHEQLASLQLDVDLTKRTFAVKGEKCTP